MLFSKKRSDREKPEKIRNNKAERKAFAAQLHFYKVVFHHKNGLVTKLQPAKSYREASKNFTLHKVFLVDASNISQDGELTVMRKIAADFYDKRGTNVAILGFKGDLPAWVYDSIGDDLYFVRR
ncbi:MAG: hypothetical protein Q4C22_01600 [Bacillota bacterium]|nr:hypothetical protein [Bacillota bacterium]